MLRLARRCAFGCLVPLGGCALPPMGTPSDDVSSADSGSSSTTSAEPGASSGGDETSGEANRNPPICGDGVRSAEEACDLGGQNGSPGSDCLEGCVVNVCGDFHLGPGEGCDVGPEDTAECEGCVPTTCGNGLDPGEICDPAEPGIRGASCSETCSWRPGAFHVAGGNKGTCAVLHGGFVKCWGYNEFHNSGYSPRRYGTNIALTVDTIPEQMPCLDFGDSRSGRMAIQVARGDGTACVLFDDKAVRCWGLESSGKISVVQKAYEDRLPAEIPDVAGLPPLESIAMGYRHACGLTADGQVWCWGSNLRGQTGVECDEEEDPCLGRVELGGSATSLAVGRLHNCAVVDRLPEGDPDGQGDTVTCWGRDTSDRPGILGLGPLPDPDFGDQLEEIQAIAEVSVEFSTTGQTPLTIAGGSESTCLVVAPEVGLRCWGHGDDHSLGDDAMDDYGLDTPPSAAPLHDFGGARIVKQATGFGVNVHGVVVGEASKRVHLWGRNSFGQLGLGLGPEATEPRSIAQSPPLNFDSPVQQLELAPFHACVVLDRPDSPLLCWGHGNNGRLGNASGETIGDQSTELPDDSESFEPVALGSGCLRK
ncbi:MAG: RCC1 domain-containing protein [Myxococcota bacterium]